MSDEIKSNKVKGAQVRNIFVLIFVVLMSLMLLVYMLSDKESSQQPKINEKEAFSSPLDRVDVQSTILEKTQKQLAESEKKSQTMQQQLDSLLSSKNADDQIRQKGDEDMKARLASLEKQYSTADSHVLPTQSMSGSQSYQGNILPAAIGENVVDISGQGIKEDKLNLVAESSQHTLPIKNSATYVPPGTFAKAVMIGGADASAAVNAQANPTPMLFRLIENGTLPNHRKSHLKDCVVTAAVVGDISSERGMIRLENLSCVFPNNEIVDQSVEGTIFGPEGKNGVRGNPVWREGALLQRAFAAGALSGLSNGISQTYTSNSISQLGNVQTVDNSKMIQYGLASGAGKAMDKLAEYNIQRADQYHPVIQLSAGTVVDVVFLKGFFLDGKKHESDAVQIAHVDSQNQPSLFQMTPTDAQTLPLSAREVQRLQEKNKELGLRVSPMPTES